jgi:hypothetical protein
VVVANRVDVTGTVSLASAPQIASGSVTGLLLGGIAVSNANPVPISDAGGIITVDGTVSATQGTSPWVVSGSAWTQHTQGDLAHDVADVGNPLKIGSRAFSGSLPTAVATNDRANAISDRYGRILTAGQIDPAQQVWKARSYTSQATGQSFWIPASGSCIAITHLVVATGGTTAGRVTVWFGPGNDTAYTEETDQAVFDGEFVPSANSTPGAILQPTTPIYSAGHTKTLKVTTSAAMTVRVQAYGYEFVP